MLSYRSALRKNTYCIDQTQITRKRQPNRIGRTLNKCCKKAVIGLFLLIATGAKSDGI
ncbi:hypothetical protein QWZ13_11285 [Reinekea marina]|uniref:hypothetical protein n=1 Tax=Reinekea marina TaxID=1310421 RepID=UPI0025B426A9|nr:hypothetical protein [Reinekea marina]MDN3649497.1 hypothetical protein [Reinekea marina]